jgi:predicted permease
MCVGGGRARLLRQFLTESLLLALFGGALALVFAQWGTAAIMSLFNAAETPLLLDVSPSPRVLAFTAGIAIVTGIAFGLVPAFASTRVDLTPALKDAAISRRARRWSSSHALVAGQIALSIVVLAVAALLGRTLYNLKSIDAGFTPGNLLLVTLDTYGTPIPEAARLSTFREVLDRVKALPGVEKASLSRSTPIHTSGNARALVMPPGASERIEDNAAFTNPVSPEYFDTMGIRLLRGRVFTSLDDAASARHVAVINETMAKFWAGDRDPIGVTLAFKGNPKDQITIVGVVEDTYQMNLREAPPRTVYTTVAKSEQPPSGLTLELRTAGNPGAIVAAVREAVRGVNRSIVIRYVRTIDQQIDASLVRERVLATLSAGFAVLALTLCAIGLYGVMSYTVTRRSREIGIRMALGAARGRVLRQVLLQTFAIAGAGTIVGVIAAMRATRTLDDTFLYGLSERDPLTIGGVAISLLVISMAAGLLPARRAASLDPVKAIKTE